MINYIYIADFGFAVKVGASIDPDLRIKAIERKINSTCLKSSIIECNLAYDAEAMIKENFKDMVVDNDDIKNELFSCSFKEAKDVSNKIVDAINICKSVDVKSCKSCGIHMGFTHGKRQYCSDKCRQKAYRNRQDEKLANQESTKESRTDNSNVHGEAQPQT